MLKKALYKRILENDFYHSIVDSHTDPIAIKRIRNYLAFVSSMERRIWLISPKAHVFEFDFNDSVVGRQYLSKDDLKIIDFNDSNELIKHSYFYVKQDTSYPAIQFKVWHEVLYDIPNSFKIAIDIAQKCNRRAVEIQIVIGFQGELTLGKTHNMTLDQFTLWFNDHYNDRVSDAFL